MKHRLLLIGTSLLMMVMSFSLANAQERSISGTVNDENGLPLPGVSVIIKGTTTGGTTDFDGNFKVSAPNENVTLQLSYIGYEMKEVVVTNQSNLGVITLDPSAEELDEVIVIGYGTQKKSDKTGAVASVATEEMNQGVMTDPIAMIAGKVAGVTITKKGGDPNGGFSVKIRGSSGLSSGTDPLYVVDGVPGVDPTTIANEDIQSMNVLKDASSTAIYGSRGANGVIIITTKSGKGQKGSNINVSAFRSFDQVANRLDLMTADEVRAFAQENSLNIVDGGANTDWQDAIYRMGANSNVNVSASGASEDADYRLSVSHNDFQGVIKGSSKQRTLARISVNQKTLDGKLQLGGFVSGMIENNDYISYSGNGPRDVLYQAFQRNPTDPLYDEDGNLYQIQRDFNYNNPLATIEEVQNERQARNMTVSFNTSLNIVDGLTWKTNTSYFRNDNETFYFEPTYSWPISDGFARRASNNSATSVLETTLNYDKKLGAHSLNLIGGYSYQFDETTGLSAQGRGASSDYVKSYNLGFLNTVTSDDISSWKNSSKLISFFGRATYNYNSKYFVTATVRRDGSSKFGDNNKWGIFPSASVAWAVKDEFFLKNVDWLSELKLRAGYGLVGNQEIPPYLSQDLNMVSGSAIDPITGQPVRNITGTRNPNPDLKWEENSELNIGLDFGLFSDKVNGSLEVYNKRTYDLIYNYAVPVPPNKYATTYANGGDIENRGIELFLEWYALDTENLDWTTNIVFSKNEQKVLSLASADGSYRSDPLETGWVSGRGLVGTSTQRVQPGYAVGTFYMPEFAGFSEDGKFLFYTEAGGVTRDETKAAKKVVGNAQPDFELAWSNFFKIGKGFDISFNLRAVVGFDVLNVTKMVLGNPNVLPSLNALASARDEYAAGMRDNAKVSDYYLEDGSFIRMDNFTLGYTFQTANVEWLKQCRVYTTVNNMFLITDYSGIDPEVGYSGLSFGIDQYNTYPKTRSITVGMNVTF
ncbi:SusC/RagA family TonB-linked outer membrane protein [Sediminitomix flava]|uniref:Iron complex outermembrane receptor protein n=1 Tax=Sediminitomix flava TaxID=379075 RepID=A0A315ZAW2_SEDFL|nr:SusC/RagA family TonB-linked outer membrane protein [Sediminitomix flava]PWJ42490.1 iron complex outermembrane receptor protein [Sediminitomix flava]